MKNFLIALQFLTILPVKITSVKNEDFGRSLQYFPIVGLFIGLILCVIAFLTSPLPDMVTAAIIIIGSIVITAGLHLDGFADTCDGFYGSKSKEKILEIMHDSHIGVMGVSGVVGILLLKFSLLVNMPKEVFLKTLILMTVFSRWSQVLACYTSRYARQEGKAKNFIEYTTAREFLLACAIAMGLSLLLLGLKGVLFLVLAVLPVLLFIEYAKKRIGGMTGDTIGATNEIAEAAMLFVCLF